MTTIIFVFLMFGGTFALGIGDTWRKKYLKEGIDEQSLLTVTLFLTGVLLLPVLLVVGFPEIKEGFWLPLFGTIALNLISQNLFIRAFKLSDASLIAPLRLIIPPLVILTGFVFLGEKPTWLGAIGIIVTMIGLWFLLFKKEDATWSRLTAIMKPGFNRSLTGVLTKDKKALLLISVASSAGVFLTNQALNYSLAAYVSSLKRLQALWTVLLAGALLKEKEIRRRVFATIIMFLGILLSVLIK